MRIKTDQLIVSTIDNSICFEDVEFELDEDNTALVIFEDNDLVTVFPLRNILYFSYYAKKGSVDNDNS